MKSKKAKTELEKFVRNKDNYRMFQQEGLIFKATEMICGAMERRKVSRSALARRLGKSKPYVTQLLDGETNMTLRTLSDCMFALGFGVDMVPIALPFHKPARKAAKKGKRR